MSGATQEDSQIESQAGPRRTSADRQEAATTKRAARACLQCRQRKQRCAGPSQIPCSRCAEGQRACSFEQDINEGQLKLCLVGRGDEMVIPFTSDPVLLALQTTLARVVSRVETLESLLGADAPPKDPAPAVNGTSQPPSALTPSDDFAYPQPLRQDLDMDLDMNQVDMNQVDMNSSALRTMGIISQQQQSLPARSPPDASGMSSVGSARKPPEPHRHARTDPVKMGVLSMSEAQKMLDIYWENCHAVAPLLCRKTQTQAYALASSPFLFCACLTVGARYWNVFDKSKPIMHPKYFEIVKIMDQNVADLMLRTDASDISLGAVQALLLYIQWAPIDPGSPTSSRFNENSVWLMIGLAGRIAKLLDLQRTATAPFSGDLSLVTDEDMARMRVWLNLTSNDHFIWLMTNFAASLDSTSGVACARTFAGHANAQQNDLYAASLAEIISIADNALRVSGKRTLAELDSITIRRANEQLREWEAAWVIPLASQQPDRSIISSMPLTSLRWYRLAINGAHANACITGQREMFHCTAFSLCVDAAAELLFSFSNEASESSGLGYRTMRFHTFEVDPAALRSLIYTVDYHWVIHAFAAAFLAQAYARGALDCESAFLPSEAALKTTFSRVEPHRHPNRRTTNRHPTRLTPPLPPLSRCRRLRPSLRRLRQPPRHSISGDYARAVQHDLQADAAGRNGAQHRFGELHFLRGSGDGLSQSVLDGWVYLHRLPRLDLLVYSAQSRPSDER
ncbi:hypothetical protein FB451DRAFT_255015 [Mycena latifolia]|nr:hypothetical protein FB451DRAFT_255015 [Mycena latifolia]